MRNREQIIICMILCCFLGIETAYSQISKSSMFHLQGASYKVKAKADSPIKEQTQIPLDIAKPITSLGLSGSLDMEAEDSYVRITLQDIKGKEYLVYETFPLLSGGYHETWESVAMETIDLYDVLPSSLKVEAYKSSIRLSDIIVGEDTSRHKAAKAQFNSQEEEVISILNKGISRQKLLWKAGKTSVSSLAYEQKKARMGNNPAFFYGLEYYTGGVFSFPGVFSNSAIVEDSCFTQRFDWRDRHGKNWITPAKEQRGLTCWAFASASAVEARANIYFNDTINYDLSEQNLVSCVYPQHVIEHFDSTGGFTRDALRYIKNNGIVLESCFPFEGKVPCENKCDNPSEIISISSYRGNPDSSHDYDRTLSELLRKSVIKSPVAIDYFNASGHSLCCVGFYLLTSQDTVFTDVLNGHDTIEQIDSSSAYFNNWVWILKNSWGRNWGEDGFGRVVFPNTIRLRIYHLEGNVSSLILSEKHRLVTDEDGDGCFVWGGGPRPAFLPSYAGNNEDGDDSNPTIGEMNEFGKCQSDNIEHQRWMVSTPTAINRNCLITSPGIVVSAGGILRIDDVKVTMKNDVDITVEDGGVLCIDSGQLENVSVTVKPGGGLVAINNGKITLYPGARFKAEKGAIVNVSHGKVTF